MIITPSAPIDFGLAAGAHHLVGPFRAGADQHRHAAGRLLDDDLDDLPPFVGRHAQELAGAAERDQAVDAFVDLEVDQPLRSAASSTFLPSAVNGVIRTV